MTTSATPPVTPPASQPATSATVSGTGAAGSTIPAPSPLTPVKSDAHQIANDAKAAFNSISATAKADFAKLLADVEAAEGTSVDAIRKLFGI